MSGTLRSVCDSDEFNRHLGEAIGLWNQAEMFMKQLLVSLLGPDTPYDRMNAELIISEMGSRQLSNAIRTISSEGRVSVYGEHVTRAVDIYDQMLAYRNYYVHGILHIQYHATDDFPDGGGFIMHTTAKGKHVQIFDIVSLQALKIFKDRCRELQGYVRLVSAAMSMAALGRELPLPDKPPVPP